MRLPSATSPAIVATVSATATSGSHQVASPMEMRVGMASGAVTGNQATSRAQVVPALPIAANETMNPSTRRIVTGPVTLDASSVRDARDPSVPKTVA